MNKSSNFSTFFENVAFVRNITFFTSYTKSNTLPVGVTMGITKSTVRVGQKPPKEAIQEARRAAKKPIKYTKDAPRSTPEALAEFAALRAAQKKKDVRPVVALRIQPEVLEKYKSLGRGYSGIMADVLRFAVDNPEILKMIRV
jgi:uncharacterized protein (DUF4415 family)